MKLNLSLSIYSLGSLVYCALLYAQFHDIYYHYFEFTNADKVSLAISLIIPLLLSYRFIKTTHRNLKFIGTGLLVVIPLTIHSIVFNLLGWSDYSWIIMHFIIAVGGVSIAIASASRWMILPLLTTIWVWTAPNNYEQSQIKYYDKVIAGIETRKGSGQIVQWKSDYWIHYNGELQFSTIDAHVFSEAFIQPVMHLNDQVRDVLIIGGDNGQLVDELLKFNSINSITLIPYDKGFYDFVGDHREILQLGPTQKIKILNGHIQHFLADTSSVFDLIVVDLAEPIKVEFRQYYSKSFYQLCFDKLRPNGNLVSKTTGSYTRFGRINEIQENIQTAGFEPLAYHTQIPTLGQYSWVIGSKRHNSTEMMSTLRKVKPKVSTGWWNQEAMKMMLSFGKTSYFSDTVNQNDSM